jgi:sigma-B regulation protein RsbU (phosphoserine phosphatase)
MSFRVKWLLFSTAGLLIGLGLAALIAFFGLNNLQTSAINDAQQGVLRVNQHALESLVEYNTGVPTNIDLTQFEDLLLGLKIGQTGFIMVGLPGGMVQAVSDNGAKLLGLHPPQGLAANFLKGNLHESSVPEVAKIQIPAYGESNITQITLNGELYQVILKTTSLKATDGTVTPTFFIGFVVPIAPVLAELDTTENDIQDNATIILRYQIIAMLVVISLVVIAAYFLSNRMTASLKALAQAARRLQTKDYTVRVEVKARDEVGEVAHAFNNMVEEIKNYTTDLEAKVAQRTSELAKSAAELAQANQQITSLNDRLQSENFRLKTEVEVTRRLQQMILPRTNELALIPDLEIAGYMEPAAEVGGDYYDVLQEDGKVKIGIGDVTGHGLESGVVMLMVQTAVRTLMASDETSPKRYLSILNRAIYDNVQRMSSDKNLSLSLLDYEKGQMRLSGQHEEVILMHNDGQLELIGTMNLGFPVGLEQDISQFLAEKTISLNPGDTMVLYTDGITEAENDDKEQYGLTRLCEVIRTNYKATAEEIKQAVITDLRNFIGRHKVYDDITLLVLKQKGWT